MKKLVLVSWMLIIAFGSFAQQDQKAKDILNKVSEKTSSFKSISADFVFTMQNKEMDIDEKSLGSIVLKEKKYKVHLPDLGTTVFSNGKTIWTYMKEGNQVTISDIDADGSELMDPSSLLTIYEKGFRSEYVAEEKIGNVPVFHINLFPDSDEFEVEKVEVYINKSTLFIYSAVLNADGNQYKIEVKKLDTNKDVPDSVFEFNAADYPDVEIIDFR